MSSRQAAGRIHAAEGAAEGADAERRGPAHGSHDLGRTIAPCLPSDRFAIGIDITTCRECGGRLRWIADVTEPAVIRKILNHVRSRAPPERRMPCAEQPTADRAFTLAG